MPLLSDFIPIFVQIIRKIQRNPIMLPPTYGTSKRRFRYNGVQSQSFLLNSRRPFSLKFVQTCKKDNIALQFRLQF